MFNALSVRGGAAMRVENWVTIYALCEPIGKYEIGEPRYVGKTIQYPHERQRAHLRAAKCGRLPVHQWLREQTETGATLCLRHLERVPPGGDWQDRERYWIAKFRADGFRLLNIMDGGEGWHGHKFAGTEHARKIGAALRRGAMFNCEQCGTAFWRKPHEITKGDCRFCSRNCYQLSQRGVSKRVSALCIARGVAAAAAKRHAQTNCKRGHPLSGDNVFQTLSGSRGCKECRKLHKLKYRGKLL